METDLVKIKNIIDVMTLKPLLMLICQTQTDHPLCE